MNSKVKFDTDSPLHVVTSCSGRFHIFDQARELARHGLLSQLITDYPRSYAARFGIPVAQIQPLLALGVFNHALRRYGGIIPSGGRNRLFHFAHDVFSRRLAAVLPSEMDFFIGLSSFCREALMRARDMGVPCAVDHGSLDQSEDRRLIQEEAVRWGVVIPPDISPEWVIEKEREEFALADYVFALSSVARDSLVRNGVAEGKIFVNPCGVDLADFRPGEKEDGVFRVIQVGAISLRKGVLDTLQAFAQAPLKGSELWLVGGGLKASGLAGRIADLRVPGVEFIEPVPQNRLRELYVQSSVFVLASVADGFGMVVPQAMACGLPVIVTENVGAKDLLRDGENGFIVPIRDPGAIAERLQLLHDDPGLARRMGEKARATVEHGYAWTDYGNRLASFLHDTVGR